jgi:hypothetical protein
MIDVLIGGRAEGAPEDTRVRRLEGWILGQQPNPIEDNRVQQA